MRKSLIALPALALLAACAGGDTVDGMRGNPPGTAAERAFDRAAGTNTSGAFPQQTDGTRANPTGTAATRALDRAAGTNT
ncbi:MAG: hypothetical protein K2X11_14985, partial [Acetobacteraceae bacterium]|nr:hypothetical protein [Acetobacteraceae bacterium]